MILESLLRDYNDGRRKNFYCTAVNLLGLADLKDIMEHIEKDISGEAIPKKDRVPMVVSLFEEKGKSRKLDFRLRK